MYNKRAALSFSSLFQSLKERFFIVCLPFFGKRVQSYNLFPNPPNIQATFLRKYEIFLRREEKLGIF